MIIGKYTSQFKELGKRSTLFYHIDKWMKCIKFENEFRSKLIKTIEHLKIYDFLILIHKYKFLKDFENNKNNSEPQ